MSSPAYPLAVVIASQIAWIGSELTTLLVVVPTHVVFLVVMAPIGIAAARVARWTYRRHASGSAEAADS